MSNQIVWKRRCFICNRPNRVFELVEIRLPQEIREVSVCINRDINVLTKCQERADAMEVQ